MRSLYPVRSYHRTVVGISCGATLFAVALGTQQPALARAKFEPHGDRVYTGVSVPKTWDDAGLRTQLRQYQSQVGKRAAVVTWFASTYEKGRLTSWRRNYLPTLRRVQRSGAVSLVKFSVQDYAYNQTRKMAGLREITYGVYDAYFAEFADTVRAFRSPVFISINHEMNGTWYPYSAAYPGSSVTPADYIASWRHIVDIFRRRGARNAAFVWSPNVPDVGPFSFTQYYPGDAYVDWVGVSFYSGNAVEGLDQVYQTYAAQKPIFLTEWATGVDKNIYNGSFRGEAQWLSEFFSALETRYPRVKAISWFQWDKSREGESDYRLQRVPGQRYVYAMALRNPRYLASTGNLATDLSSRATRPVVRSFVRPLPRIVARPVIRSVARIVPMPRRATAPATVAYTPPAFTPPSYVRPATVEPAPVARTIEYTIPHRTGIRRLHLTLLPPQSQ
ncbi:MAG: hypothetical protein M3347_01875 [Armatimonadota bacterium]|nr:hypothetical protein [Armatimonadota bacterium]